MSIDTAHRLAQGWLTAVRCRALAPVRALADQFGGRSMARLGALVLAAGLAAVAPVKQAEAAVSNLKAWTAEYNSATYPTSTIVDAAYTIPAGSNRMLVVAIAATRTTAGTMAASVSYGGQALTSQVTDESTATLIQHSWIFTLNQAGIVAAGANDDLVVSVSGGTADYTHVFAAVYDGVNQSAPVSNSRNFNSVPPGNSAIGPFATALTITSGDQAIEIVNLVRSNGTGNAERSIATRAANWTEPVFTGNPSVNPTNGTFQTKGYVLLNSVAGSTTSQHTADSNNTMESMSAITLAQLPVAPAITSVDNATFGQGLVESFTVTATGGPAPTFSASGALPSGITFSSGGVLSGTPANGTAGTYPLVITATNGVAPDAVQNFTLTVTATAPAITSANSTTFTVGTAGSFAVTTTGSPTITRSVSGALPTGVTFTPATGLLAGTPAAGTAGTYPLTFTAANGQLPNATQSFTLTVVATPPSITSPNARTFGIGSAGSHTLLSSGSPTITYSMTGTLPTGVTFTAATGVLAGTPGAGTAGTYPLVFTASNGTLPNATQNFTLTVVAAGAPDPDLPTATATVQTIPAGSLVIAMDQTLQPHATTIFNLRAYGLVNNLLQNSVPVQWVISTTKAKDGTDMTVNTTQTQPTVNATVTSRAFAGGPFVVPQQFVATATPLIAAFNASLAAANRVRVYQTTADVSADVRYTLTFKPFIVISDVNTAIFTTLLTAAGIPGDGTGVNQTPSLTNNFTMAPPSTLSGLACATMHMEPHRIASQVVPADITAVQSFVAGGGNFLMQCAAGSTFEGIAPVASGNFMTTTGVSAGLSVNELISYPNPRTPFSQIVGALSPNRAALDGDWDYTAFKNQGYLVGQDTTALRYAAAAGKVNFGAGAGGNVFMLGGHDYSPYTSELLVNGARMALNAVFVPAYRPGCGFDITTMSGVVFNDTNNNGVQDGGETGRSGVTVTLSSSGGGGSIVLVTDANGNYATSINPGTVTITTTTPSGYIVTTSNTVQTPSVTSGQFATGTPVGVYNGPVLTLVKTGVAGPISVVSATSTTYTLTVTNSGPGATTADIVIDDTLRTGLLLTGFSGTGWACTGTGTVNVQCTYTGAALAASGGSTSLQLTVSIAADTDDANNTARVNGGGDPVCVAPPTALSVAGLARCQSTKSLTTGSITLVKSASPTSYSAAGQVINYSLTVTNVHGGPLAGPVTVNDPLTSNESCPALTTIGNLDSMFDPAEVIVCTASYTITAADLLSASIPNTATATVSGITSPGGSTTITRAPSSVSGVVFTDSNNNGVQDGGELGRAGVTVTVSSSGGGGSIVLVTDGSGNYTTPVTPGTVTVAVTPPAGFVVTTGNTSQNQVVAPGVNATAGTVGVYGGPILTLVKTGVPGPIGVSVPTSTTYTLTVTNSGPAATSGDIVIDDTLRAGMLLTGFSGAGWNCTGTGTVNVQCTYTGAALAASGGSTSVQITASIAAATNDANNTARVNGGGDPVCVAPPTALSPAGLLRCQSTVTIATGTISLAKVASPTSYSLAGDVINYTLTVTNTNGTILHGPISVNDPLTSNESCPALTTVGNLDADLDPGEVIVCTASYTITGADLLNPSVSNSATATIDGVVSPIGTATVTRAPTSISGLVFNDLNNNGIQDGGETGQSGVSVTVTSSGGGGAIPLTTNGSGNYSTPVTPGTVSVVVSTPAGYIITTGNGTQTPTVNTGSSVVANPVGVYSGPILTLVKTGVAGPINASMATSTTYTLIVTNSGPAATTANIVINDTLRAGMLLTAFSGTGWACTGTGTINVECTYSGAPLAALGGAATLQLTVSIAPNTDDANNTARASGGGDPVCVAPPTALSPAGLARCSSTVTISTGAITLAKSASPTTYSTAGQVINYSFLVINVHDDAVPGPVTVDDPLTTNESCPSLTTIGDFDTNFDSGEQLICTATYTITAADVLNPTVVNTAIASVNGNTSAPDSVTLPRALVDAVNDNYISSEIDGVTGGVTPSVFANDTRNSVAFPPSAVIPTITNPGGLTGVSINPDGTIVVPPGTPAGVYAVTYQICLVSNNTTCDTATAQVNVVPITPIDAVNNDFSTAPVDPVAGGTTASVFTNDRLNGATFTQVQVVPTLVNDGGITGLVLNANGTLTVPAGIAPGTYRPIYRICNAAASGICDQAEVVILVAGLDAVDDDFSTSSINGIVGGSTPTVYGTDTLAGFPIAATTVTPSISNDGGLTGVQINGDGTLTVPAGAAAGDYSVTYQICLVSNPSVCDTAVVDVRVGGGLPIDATNDDFSASPFGPSGGNSSSVFGNDTVNAAPFVTGDVLVSLLSEGGLLGVSINPDGTISVPPGAPAGTYHLSYQICVVTSPADCDVAQATVVVSALDAVTDDFSLNAVNGTTGGTTASVYGNDTLNGASFAAASVTPSITALGGLPVGTTINATGGIEVPAGTPAGSYVLTYQICLVASPTVCDSANATVVVSTATSPELNVTKTVTPDPVVLGQSATYTITINNTGSATTQDITITDQLRVGVTLTGFSGTNWSCTGTSLVICTYSGVLAASGTTQLLLTVAVAESAVSGNNTARASGGGDSGCPAPPAFAKDRCSGSVLTGTVPVTLSDVEVVVEGSTLVVRFGTASEAGTLAFQVLSNRPGQAQRQPVGNDLLVAKGSTLKPQRYETRAAFNGQSQIWIEELATDGSSTSYGPYAVGSRTGERDLTVNTNWAMIRTEQAAFRAAQAQAILGRGRGLSAEALASVNTSGWVRVRHEDLLAQGIDWTGANPDQVTVSRGGTLVPVRYQGPAQFGSGSEVYFLARAVEDSLYTRTAVYRLRVAGATARALAPVYAAPAALPQLMQTTHRIVHAPNREYSYSSPTTDPWYAFRVTRVNTPLASATETFTVPNKATGTAAEHIDVELWGGLNFREAPDHSVRLLLNGTLIATRQFDGLTRQLISTDLAPGVLVNGSNTLTLEVVGDTGLFADIVHLESIAVSYTRQLIAVDNRLDFTIPGSASGAAASGDSIFGHSFNDEAAAACVATEAGCVAYRVSGLTRSDMVVLRERTGSVEQLSGIAATAVPGGFELSFATRSRPGDRYWIEPATGAVNAAMQPVAALTDPLAGGPATYLIVSHPSFISALTPLIAARQAEGFSVRVLDVEDLYRGYNAGSVEPAAIHAALTDAYQRLGTRYVLFVGGDTYDYFNITGANSLSFVPTYYRAADSVVRFAPADSDYADVTGDGLADLSIGRFPVRTLAELNNIVAKTLSYAQAGHARKTLRVSDRDQATVSFNTQLSTVGSLLGASWPQSNISLQTYPTGSAGLTQARADLVSAVNAGQSLLTFFGHSAPSSWTRESMVTAALVYGGLFSNTNQPTAVWQLGCWGAYFVDPQYNTVAHGLMLQNNAGAAAVFGASGLTQISSDVAWLNSLTPQLKTQRIGDAIRLTQRLLRAQGVEFNDIVVGGTLLGDPALRLRQ